LKSHHLRPLVLVGTSVTVTLHAELVVPPHLTWQLLLLHEPSWLQSLLLLLRQVIV